jgi:hypothetical protein
MGEIRLYRKIYRVGLTPTVTGTTQTYTLVDPYVMFASSFVAGSGATESDTLVEYHPTIFQDAIGIFYTDLNPTLYATDVTYDLVWYVQYTDGAPEKKLTTRFRLNNQSVSSEISTEILSNQQVSIEILSNTLEIEIL